jgi:hypothetical protein
MLGTRAIFALPAVGDYLTDEHALICVVGYDGPDVLAEDVSVPLDQPGALRQLDVSELEHWRAVIPQA